MLPTIDWSNDAVVMVDQRKLPRKETYVTCRTASEVARAIRKMVIRGAPAIGVAAAMGIALGVNRSKLKGMHAFATEFYKTCDLMAATRPTAVNLSWAIDFIFSKIDVIRVRNEDDYLNLQTSFFVEQLFSKRRANIVVNRRDWLEEEIKGRREQFYSHAEIADVIEGTCLL